MAKGRTVCKSVADGREPKNEGVAGGGSEGNSVPTEGASSAAGVGEADAEDAAVAVRGEFEATSTVGGGTEDEVMAVWVVVKVVDVVVVVVVV